MGNNIIAKKVYVGEFTGSRYVGRPQKKVTDTMKECLRKKKVWMSGKQEE